MTSAEPLVHRFLNPLNGAEPDLALRAGGHALLVHKGLLNQNSSVLATLSSLESELIFTDPWNGAVLPLLEVTEYVLDADALVAVMKLTYGDITEDLMQELTTDIDLFRLVLDTLDSLQMGITKKHLENLLTVPFWINPGWRIAKGFTLKKVLEIVEFLNDCHEHGLDTLTQTALERNLEASLAHVEQKDSLDEEERNKIHALMGRISERPGNPATDLLINLMVRSLGGMAEAESSNGGHGEGAGPGAKAGDRERRGRSQTRGRGQGPLGFPQGGRGAGHWPEMMGPGPYGMPFGHMPPVPPHFWGLPGPGAGHPYGFGSIPGWDPALGPGGPGMEYMGSGGRGGGPGGRRRPAPGSWRAPSEFTPSALPAAGQGGAGAGGLDSMAPSGGGLGPGPIVAKPTQQAAPRQQHRRRDAPPAAGPRHEGHPPLGQPARGAPEPTQRKAGSSPGPSIEGPGGTSSGRKLQTLNHIVERAGGEIAEEPSGFGAENDAKGPLFGGGPGGEEGPQEGGELGAEGEASGSGLMSHQVGLSSEDALVA